MDEYMSFDSIFDTYCSFRDFRAVTKKEYRYIIGSFLRESGCEYYEVSVNDAESYFQNMLSRHHRSELSTYTISVRVKVCRDFYSYLFECGIITVNPFEGIKPPAVDDTPFTGRVPMSSDIEAALLAAKKFGESAYLSLCLVVRMALTDSDLVCLKTSNVVTVDDNVYLRFTDTHSKTAERFLLVPDDLKDKVLSYRHLCPFEYMFPSNRGTRYSIKGLERRNEKIMEAAGLKGKFSMKDFRTRAILQMLGDGADPSEVAIYANVTMRRIRSYGGSNILNGVMLRSCPANMSCLKIV